jgi:hypothetical protein
MGYRGPGSRNGRKADKKVTNGASSNTDLERSLRKAIADAPEDVDPRLQLIRLLDSDNRFEEALPQIEDIRALRPRNKGFARLQARTLFRLGHTDAAADALGDGYAVLAGQFLARLSAVGRGGSITCDGAAEKLQPWLVKLLLRREFTYLGGQAARDFICQGVTDASDAPATGKEWFFTLKNRGCQLHQPVPPELTLHMHDTCLMLQEQRPRVFNPLAGRLSDCALSLLPDLALLRDTNDNVLVSSAPRLFASSTFETAFILPRQKLIIDTRSENAALIYELLAADLAALANDEFSMAAFADEHAMSRGITLADRPVDHLGHLLWNRLSSWATLYQCERYRNATRLVSWEVGEYFGNPFDLYPEYGRCEVQTQRITDRDAAVASLQDNASFWLPMYDRYIRQDLADRVLRHCHNVAAPEFQAELSQWCAGRAPIVLLTLRLGNRVWVEQLEGYANIIRNLAQAFPAAAFILDGMTVNKTTGTTTRYMDCAGEQALARAIIAQLDADIAILNTIGVPTTHSVLAGESADAFIAPWGTGMTKYKWISNKPGVAFGNSLPAEAALSAVGIRVFDKFRENILTAVEIDPAHITDAGSGNLGDPLRRNFSMPWQPVYDAIVGVLLDMGFKPGQARNDVAPQSPGPDALADCREPPA